MIQCPKCKSTSLETVCHESSHTQLGHLDGQHMEKYIERCNNCGNIFKHYIKIPKQMLKGKRLIKGYKVKTNLFSNH